MTLTGRNIRPHLFRNGEKSTNLYQKAVETLFMDFAHCVAVKFIYAFQLFPEVQKCYVFWHCTRLFVYLCISFISRSPITLFSGTVHFARQVHLSGQFLKQTSQCLE